MRIGLSTLWLLIWICSGLGLQAASAEILKVLPHYLDEAGRHSLSPSLYERDAYQAYLREYPEKRSALRFDIHWKAKRARGQTLVLRIELRSSGRDFTNPIVLERQVHPARFFSRWSSLRLEGEDYKTFGQLMAWRASLWQGNEMLAEKKSFLW